MDPGSARRFAALVRDDSGGCGARLCPPYDIVTLPRM